MPGQGRQSDSGQVVTPKAGRHERMDGIHGPRPVLHNGRWHMQSNRGVHRNARHAHRLRGVQSERLAIEGAAADVRTPQIEDAGPIVDDRHRVIIDGLWVGTARHGIRTVSVIHRSEGVVVGRFRIRAPLDRLGHTGDQPDGRRAGLSCEPYEGLHCQTVGTRLCSGQSHCRHWPAPPTTGPIQIP